MSDDESEQPTMSAVDTDDQPDSPTQAGATDTDGESNAGRFRTAVNYLVLAGLGLTLLIAGLQFYTSVSATINQFVAREFRPIVRAVFNLGLVVLAAAGVSIQLRRMR